MKALISSFIAAIIFLLCLAFPLKNCFAPARDRQPGLSNGFQSFKDKSSRVLLSFPAGGPELIPAVSLEKQTNVSQAYVSARGIPNIGNNPLQQASFRVQTGGVRAEGSLPTAANPGLIGDNAKPGNSIIPAAGQSEWMASLLSVRDTAEQLRLLESQPELISIQLEKEVLAEGERLFGSSQYARARQVFQLAQQIAERRGEPSGVVMAMRRAGDCFFWQGDNEQAGSSYHRALELAQSLGDRRETGFLLKGLGSYSHVKGKFAEALDYYQKSLEIGEELQDRRIITNGEIGRGAALLSLGNPGSALISLRHGLELENQMGDKEGVARALVNIGNVYTVQGQYTRALECYQQTLPLMQELDKVAWLIPLLNNIGLVYRFQGNYDLAMEYYQRSLDLNQKRLRNEDSIALSLINLGVIHFLQGKREKASSCLQKALELTASRNNLQHRAVALHQLGEINRSSGQFTQAFDYYRQSLALASEMDYKPLVIRLLGSMARVDNSMGNPLRAVETAEKAIQLSRELGSLEKMWGFCFTAGQGYLQLQQVDKARQSFSEAIGAIEKLRGNVAGDELAVQRYLEDKTLPYLTLLDLEVRQSNPWEALDMAEKIKGRVLVDVLRGGHSPHAKVLTAEERKQEQQWEAEIGDLQRQLQFLEIQPRHSPAQWLDLNARLQRARDKREDFLTRLFAMHPEIRLQRGQLPALNHQRMESLFPDNSTALLEYAVLPEKVYLFVLSRQQTPGSSQGEVQLKVHEVLVPSRELSRRIRQFQRRLARCESGYRQLARDLYNLLLKPAESQLRGISTLCIIPDGSLWELPFQALESNSHRFVLNQFAVFYSPSLTALESMMRRQVPPNGRPTLLAYGNPAGLWSGSSLPLEQQTRGMVANLDDAEQEVAALKRLYGDAQSTVHVRSDASEKKAHAELGNYRILHFATHGILDAEDPMYSYLSLTPQGQSRANDGRLEANEILGMELRADLAVLSACQSAGGRVGSGEGLIGMSWAFFVAGCPTTVVSQWKVDSRSSRQLMVDFHRNLLRPPAEGESPHTAARALQQAALRLQKSSLFRHPFYWAPFIVMGKNAAF